MNIAEKLVKLRKESGLTQENLTQKLGISISAIRNYENIKKPREPKNDMLLKFAEFYNVSTEYLLNDDITNKTKDNIDIGNKINLSDEAIEKIIKINNDNKYNVLETFINIMPESFWKVINGYFELNKRMQVIKPLQEISKYATLLKKYSTKDELEVYLDFYEEIGGCVLNYNAYFKNNKCNYTTQDKEKILECIELIQYNKALRENSFDNTEDDYLMHEYDFSIGTVKKIVNANAYIPLSIVNTIISIPDKEMKNIEARKEVAKLSLYELSTDLLKYLDKQEQEAE